MKKLILGLTVIQHAVIEGILVYLFVIFANIVAFSYFSDNVIATLGVMLLNIAAVLFFVWDARSRYVYGMVTGERVMMDWINLAGSVEERNQRMAMWESDPHSAMQTAKFNVDGTPMMGNSGFDINGNIFGITNNDVTSVNHHMSDPFNHDHH